MTPKTAERPLLGTLREGVRHYLDQRLESLASAAGEKLTDVTKKLTDNAESGTPLDIGNRMLKGDSPLRAAASGVKDKIPGLGGDKKEEKGSGGDQDGPGDVKATNIVEMIDVGVPLRTAYDHWCGYEEFASFTNGVQDVSKEDEVSSDWKLKIGPSNRSWKATVVEQLADDRIVWKSEGSKGTTHGVVSFHELAPTLTRIVVVVEYYPSGFLEKTGNLWRVQGRRLRLDLKHFQRYVSFSTEEPEGWRGEIEDSEVVLSHEDAVAEEEDGDGDEGGEEDESGEEDGGAEDEVEEDEEEEREE